MVILEILLSGLVLLLLVPVSLLFAQVLMALPAYRNPVIPAGPRPSVAVLVPAHNEASCIAETLGLIEGQLVGGDRLVVIADNCTDDTATVARAAGAEVIERNDVTRRGKGYALDFAVRFLELDPPRVVIVVDADCQVGSQAIDHLARICEATTRPVQALNLMHAREGAGLNTRIAEFAWLVKNMVRPLGFQRLGLPCQLMGTGMAFPWAAISTANLASGHIVEDLLLGVDLARARVPPLFYPAAQVKSYFPSSGEGLRIQRTRWEHGHLGMVFHAAPRAFGEAVANRNWMLLALVIDMCVPPLALLTLLALTASACATAFFASTGSARPFWLAVVTLALLGVSVLLSWGRFGRKVIPLTGLFHVPAYLLRKIPLYAMFLRKRQVEWVRSKREAP